MKEAKHFLTTFSTVQKIVGLFLLWRGLLFVISLIAPHFLPYQPSFPYSRLLEYDLPQWLYSWAGFDGVHYLTIVKEGYLTVNFIQAFFPGFPLLVQALNTVHPSDLLNGLLLSNVLAVVAFLLWFSFLKSEYSSKKAWVGLAIFALFPTAFFLGAYGTESLFLCLVFGCFWAARRQKWWLAGLLAAVASATRIVGVFLVPALLVEWLIQYHEATKTWLWQVPTQKLIQIIHQNWLIWLSIALGSVGLLLYMCYLNRNFNDALYFFHVQSEFGSGRQENLILFPQVVWRYIKIMLTYRPIDLKFFAIVQEFLVTLAGLGLLALAVFKKIRWSYIIFASAAFFLPPLTGNFSSMARYVLVCFPIFMVLTEYLHNRPRLMVGYLVLSGLLLAINTILFIQGYWVA